MNNDIKKAVKILKQGGIVIFPTDTAFGIGCAIDHEEAIKRLFKIRKRPKNQATPVLVDTVRMAEEYVEKIPKDVVDRLIEPHWPGALTIVLQSKTHKVPKLVRGGGNTLGVRIPNHDVPRAIMQALKKPILGPSANFHGEKTPYALKDLDPDLVSLVDYVIPGKTRLQSASTVIDCTKKPWKILRQGKVRITNSVILFIDTASCEEISVDLVIDGKKDVVKQKIGKQKTQVVLPIIDTLLRKHSLKLEDVTAIKVNEGPGSFTGIRVGVSIANALGFSLHVPVNGKKKDTFVKPTYF